MSVTHMPGSSFMTVSDAKPADIYVDPQGKLWRCVGICTEPTVIFEEVEGTLPEQPDWQKDAASIGIGIAAGLPGQKPKIVKTQKHGGVAGLMWSGWKRIHRPEG